RQTKTARGRPPSRVSGRPAAVARRAGGGSTHDLRAGGRDEVPGAGEVVQACRVRLTARGVAGERVQRVAPVRPLPASVAALRPAEPGCLDARLRTRFGGRDQRRPLAGAAAVAAALTAAVPLEQVQRTAVPVHAEPSELRLRDRDAGGAGRSRGEARRDDERGRRENECELEFHEHLLWLRLLTS